MCKKLVESPWFMRIWWCWSLHKWDLLVHTKSVIPKKSCPFFCILNIFRHFSIMLALKTLRFLTVLPRRFLASVLLLRIQLSYSTYQWMFPMYMSFPFSTGSPSPQCTRSGTHSSIPHTASGTGTRTTHGTLYHVATHELPRRRTTVTHGSITRLCGSLLSSSRCIMSSSWISILWSMSRLLWGTLDCHLVSLCWVCWRFCVFRSYNEGSFEVLAGWPSFNGRTLWSLIVGEGVR